MTQNKEALSFDIKRKIPNTLARSGKISTPHGDIQTPAYIGAATAATMKTLTNAEIDALGAQSILSNTYHLMLRPGADLLAKAGGIHKFMNYHKPMYTDSGGFQVYSLGMAFKKGLDATSHTTKGSAENAVMKAGKIIAQDTTEGLVKQIEAKVWQGNIPMEQLARWEYRLRVVNLRNEPDGTVTLRYLADAPQLPDSVPAQPRLEDLYLWLFPEEMEEAK